MRLLLILDMDETLVYSTTARLDLPLDFERLMSLWRPMGQEETRLVYESRMRAFRPRVTDQPIFCPVLNLEYADERAHSSILATLDWLDLINNQGRMTHMKRTSR